MASEQRQHPRYKVQIPVHLHIDQMEWDGVCGDIAAGGLSVRTFADFAQESRLELEFVSVDSQLKCGGEIRVKIKKEKEFIYGIAFQGIPMAQTADLVEQREQITRILLKCDVGILDSAEKTD